jgi:hypothetical protein
MNLVCRSVFKDHEIYRSFTYENQHQAFSSLSIKDQDCEYCQCELSSNDATYHGEYEELVIDCQDCGVENLRDC